MIKEEKKINDNRTLKYWEVGNGGNTGLVIQENFYEDGEYVADYIIDKSNDFRFHAYKDLNFEEYEKEICHSFSFEIDHPLFIPFLNLLGGSDELVIEDDVTREYNKKYVRIYRKLNTIYLDFMNLLNSADIDKFNVFVKNVLSDGESKIDQQNLDTKYRLNRFFNEVRSLLSNDYHQVTLLEYLLDKYKDVDLVQADKFARTLSRRTYDGWKY